MFKKLMVLVFGVATMALTGCSAITTSVTSTNISAKERTIEVYDANRNLVNYKIEKFNEETGVWEVVKWENH